MPFRRYVSIGRVAYVNLAEDPLYGKLVVIVDVVDQNRVWRRPGPRGMPLRSRRRRRTPCRSRGALPAQQPRRLRRMPGPQPRSQGLPDGRRRRC